MKNNSFNTFRSPSSGLFFLFTLLLVCLSNQGTVLAQDVVAPAPAAATTGKRPIILIPGITGSQIVNPETGKSAWFTFSYSREDPDDLRLPMSPNLRQNTDSLVAKDIIREVKLPGVLKVFPEIGVYGEGVNAIKAAGYAEGDWDNPQATDVFYVFGYDWRRDNVESAQSLINKIEALKAKLNRPDLKFNIVAHSMGGLIARYAAMYGRADLPAGTRTPAPTWYGARHFNKILLFGSPNAGSFTAFDVLINGFSVVGRKLPFVMDLSPGDVFSIPALYQLMPNRTTARFLDENLKPVQIDLYNPANWRKYEWGAIGDPKFLGKLKDAASIPGIKPLEQKVKNTDDKILSETTYGQTQQFLAAVLNRARRFHQALDVNVKTSPIETLTYGSECHPTLDAVVLFRDSKKNNWRTLTAPLDFRTSLGRRISKEEIKKVIYMDGDGSVTRRSLLAEFSSAAPRKAGNPIMNSISPVKSKFFFCAEHQKLLNNATIQTNYLSQLALEAATPTPATQKKLK